MSGARTCALCGVAFEAGSQEIKMSRGFNLCGACRPNEPDWNRLNWSERRVGVVAERVATQPERRRLGRLPKES